MGYFRKEFLGFMVLFCASASSAAGQTAYTVTYLAGLSDTGLAIPTAMNESGQIVGRSVNHAFLWDNGVMTDLGTLGGNTSIANAINDKGQIVGESTTISGESHAFLWESGVITDLGMPGETSSAHGINNLGDIVGATSSKNLRGGAILWKNGKRQVLGDLGPSGSGSTAIAINGKEEIAGVSSGFASNSGGMVRAVVWGSGVIQDIGTLGGLHSSANALNDRGEVVGWSELGDHSTDAFTWQGTAMRDLGRLPGSLITAGSGSQAVAINGFGQVVGWSLNSSGESRAVIWQKNKITDLNDLARATSGLVFARAIAINNQGQILVEQQSGPTAAINSFLLTPLNK